MRPHPAHPEPWQGVRFAGDDNAVDYLYGDFGTNLNEPGSGRDRIRNSSPR